MVMIMKMTRTKTSLRQKKIESQSNIQNEVIDEEPENDPGLKKRRSLLSKEEIRSISKRHSSNSSSTIDNDDLGDDNSLDGEDIAGIVIGCVTFFLLVLIVILAVVSKTLYKPEDKYDGAQ